jgi:hypothetical protein
LHLSQGQWGSNLFYQSAANLAWIKLINHRVEDAKVDLETLKASDSEELLIVRKLLSRFSDGKMIPKASLERLSPRWQSRIRAMQTDSESVLSVQQETLLEQLCLGPMQTPVIQEILFGKSTEQIGHAERLRKAISRLRKVSGIGIRFVDGAYDLA